jgi:hypothetical protein
MPWNPEIPPEIRTVHLGEFNTDNADRIGEALEAAGIWWWTKERGGITGIWQLGVQMFVDRARLDEARSIAAGVIELDSDARCASSSASGGDADGEAQREPG